MCVVETSSITHPFSLLKEWLTLLDTKTGFPSCSFISLLPKVTVQSPCSSSKHSSFCMCLCVGWFWFGRTMISFLQYSRFILLIMAQPVLWKFLSPKWHDISSSSFLWQILASLSIDEIFNLYSLSSFATKKRE